MVSKDKQNMKVEQLSFFDLINDTPAMACPLDGRRVAITGCFTQSRQALRSSLLRLGASDVKFDKLQRNTHFLLVGENPNADIINYWRLYVHDGYNICRLHADDLRRIQEGDYAPYQVAEEVCKDVHITKEHLFWNAPEIEGLKNTRAISPFQLKDFACLYGQEIYVHHSIIDKIPELAQAMGCLGAYANTEQAEDTDSIIMPLSLPQEICSDIEEYYNNSRATQFNTPFIILEELIEFLNKRVENYPDKTLAELMETVNKKYC
jgi:hypothetical protein